jgi:hypothetical protein
MSMAIMCAPTGTGFITSDNPCVLEDLEAEKRPLITRYPYWDFPTAEVTLPISPQQALFFSWRDPEGYGDVGPEHVRAVNQRTRMWQRTALIYFERELPIGAVREVEPTAPSP